MFCFSNSALTHSSSRSIISKTSSSNCPSIINGQLDNDILEVVGRDEEWVKSELEKQNLAVNQVYVGEYLNGQLVTHSYENK